MDRMNRCDIPCDPAVIQAAMSLKESLNIQTSATEMYQSKVEIMRKSFSRLIDEACAADPPGYQAERAAQHGHAGAAATVCLVSDPKV